MSELAAAVEARAVEGGFCGVVSVDRGGDPVFVGAYGLAHRAYGVPNVPDTRFAIASGSKGLTALVVVSLVEQGVLRLSTTARSVLGRDLPLVGDEVTVEHLLAHRSGIGDYVDEDAGHAITDHVLSVPVHELAGTEDYLRVLGGFGPKFPPGQRFSYCNSGYVILALIAERTAGVPFHDLVRDRVCGPAGMTDTAYLRSDELPARTATGYLTGTRSADADARTNVFHLPVRGSGDGGAYSTAADLSRLWRALFAGRIVPEHWVAEMTRPRSDTPGETWNYGLGLWLRRTTGHVLLEGYDAGVSFRSVHEPTSGLTFTVLANDSDGAWPIARLLTQLLVN